MKHHISFILVATAFLSACQGSGAPAPGGGGGVPPDEPPVTGDVSGLGALRTVDRVGSLETNRSPLSGSVVAATFTTRTHTAAPRIQLTGQVSDSGDDLADEFIGEFVEPTDDPTEDNFTERFFSQTGEIALFRRLGRNRPVATAVTGP